MLGTKNIHGHSNTSTKAHLNQTLPSTSVWPTHGRAPCSLQGALDVFCRGRGGGTSSGCAAVSTGVREAQACRRSPTTRALRTLAGLVPRVSQRPAQPRLSPTPRPDQALCSKQLLQRSKPELVAGWHGVLRSASRGSARLQCAVRGLRGGGCTQAGPSRARGPHGACCWCGWQPRGCTLSFG